MIRYDIYCNLVSNRCPGRYTCTKIEETAICTKGETIDKTIQKREYKKKENKYTQHENKHKENIKERKSSSYKITNSSK